MIEHGEGIPQSGQSFYDVVNTLQSLVKSYSSFEVVDEGEGWYEESETTVFDGSLRPFFATPELEEAMGFSDIAKCRVIGEAQEGAGIAILVKPINPFRREVTGFYIQPERTTPDGPEVSDPRRGCDVFISKGTWPKRHGAYFGPELLDRETVRKATPEESKALFATLDKHKNYATQK